MNDAKPDDAKPDVQTAEQADEQAYIASVLEAWRRRPFFVNSAKETAERVKGLGFRAYLDDADSLLISDATGMGRDLSRFLSAADMADAFDELSAGLSDDPELLDPYQPEPQAPKPVRMRAAAAAPPQPEPVTVCAERCVHCGSNEERAGNLIIKVAVVGLGQHAFVHAKCWADWRAAQDDEPAPDINNSGDHSEEDEPHE
jgi:hypothetical protein